MSELNTKRWNEAYEAGKYEGDPPVAFVGTIIESASGLGTKAQGLYVGCGNGRNFMPLVSAGLNLDGIDISSTAITQLRERQPGLTNRLTVGDFLEFTPKAALDYIVAIQVFQHGNETEVNNYFKRARGLLKPGGLLYLRVNAIGTDIFHEHEVCERTTSGSQTVRYLDGPKKDMLIHFYSADELAALAAQHNFTITSPLMAVSEQRQAPKTGSWIQWESIWQST